jgi:acyl phosphate:glycerol-3-phosphate acyltransferase
LALALEPRASILAPMGGALVIVAAYLIGSVSFAVVVSRALRLPDPRTYGSHNPGATNVLRSGSKTAAALTLLGDALKGWLAVFLARQLAPRFGWTDEIVAVVAIAVFMGHVFPVFFQFKGGKGVATALGVLLGLSWPVGLATALVWLAMFAVTRISSLSALAAALAAPLVALGFIGRHVFLLAILVLAVMVLVRHKDNIQKLLTGREARVDKTH